MPALPGRTLRGEDLGQIHASAAVVSDLLRDSAGGVDLLGDRHRRARFGERLDHGLAGARLIERWRLLTAMARRDEYGALFDSLPIAGRDGTLVDRMRRGPASSHCHAKTGTLSDVSALSGYCEARSGDVYGFSILMNRINPTTARRLQDRMAQVLAGQR